MSGRSVNLSEHQDRFVGEVLASGRYRDVGEVVDDAFRLLERREAREAAKMKRFLALVQEGEDAYARGEYEEVPVDGIGAWLESLDAEEREASPR